MRITEISRVVSDESYGNVSAKADLLEGEDPCKKLVELDSILKKALAEMDKKDLERGKVYEKKQEAISVLEDALDYARKLDIPF